MSGVSRIVIVTPEGRLFDQNWPDLKLAEIQYQDEGRTLKVFFASATEDLSYIKRVVDAAHGGTK